MNRNRQVIFERIRDLFREVLRNDALQIEMGDAAPDVPGWDSLTHVSLILRIEREFHVRFSSREVDSLRSVGDLVALVDGRCSSKPNGIS